MKHLLIIFVHAILFLVPTAIHAADLRPNILFIFTDDHAAHAMSCYGSVINKTPNLDRIASGGMRFDRCLVTNSLCGPSRAVIQTGKYSHKNGFLDNSANSKFDSSQTTAPKLIQKAGYNTAVIGKWHLVTDPVGYDHWEILVGQGPYYNPPMIRNGERVKHEGYTTDIITDLSLKWLKEQRDPAKPFFLMLQHKAPHREWEPGPNHINKYKDVKIPEPTNLFDDYTYRGRAAHEQDMTIAKTMTQRDLKLAPLSALTPAQQKVWDDAYAQENADFRNAKLEGEELVRWKYQRYIKDYIRCIDGVDDSVGQVLDYLDASGLAQNTVVIYSSDQGFFLGDHGWFDKRFMYEESYRTPLLVRWPDKVQPGSVSKDIVSNLDYAETFLELAGVNIPTEMQGKSIVPIMQGHTPSDWRKSHYYHYYEFFNDKKTPHMVRRHCGVSTSRYKLISFYNLDEWELYDLEKDPKEMHSVYDDPAYANIVVELKAELARLQKLYEVPDDKGSVEKDPPCLDQPPKKKASKTEEQ